MNYKVEDKEIIFKYLYDEINEGGYTPLLCSSTAEFENLITDPLYLFLILEDYEKYTTLSKGKKLKFLLLEQDNYQIKEDVVEIIMKNFTHDIQLAQLKNSTTAEINKKQNILANLEKMFGEKNEKIVSSDLNDIFQKISTRKATINEMTDHEALKEICNAFENILKVGGKFQKIQIGSIIKNEDVIAYRKSIQCFRHASEENLRERENFTEIELKFYINYGLNIIEYIILKDSIQ